MNTLMLWIWIWMLIYGIYYQDNIVIWVWIWFIANWFYINELQKDIINLKTRIYSLENDIWKQ